MTPAAALVAALPFFRRAQDAGLTPAEAVARSLGGWHDFYLMAGSAAVTLVGLLFVALSFHLDTLLDERRAHLLAAARLAFLNFTFVLMLALFFLIPEIPPSLLGIACLVLAATTLGVVAWEGWRVRRPGSASAHEGFLKRRYMLSGAMMGIAVVTSLLLVLDPKVTLLVQFVPVVCAVLANAAGMSWDLLVQVGRLRRAQRAADAEAAAAAAVAAARAPAGSPSAAPGA